VLGEKRTKLNPFLQEGVCRRSGNAPITKKKKKPTGGFQFALRLGAGCLMVDKYEAGLTPGERRIYKESEYYLVCHHFRSFRIQTIACNEFGF
jgi:hypothetical protein